VPLPGDLAVAEKLLAVGRGGSAVVGWWARTAAVITRSALERSLRRYWSLRQPGLEECTLRAQLLCLRGRMGGELVDDTAATWNGLSRACHHHPYELAPTVGELRRWIAAVHRFTEEVLRQEEGRARHHRLHAASREPGRRT